jgi:Type II CAAX prenyl endopeptidase Rce1-like
MAASRNPFRGPVTAFPPGSSGAGAKLAAQFNTITVFALLLLAMAFFLLLGLNNSTLLGGVWSCWTPTYTFYIILALIGMGVAGGVSATPLMLPGSGWNFLRWFGVWAGGTWAVMSAMVHFGLISIGQTSGLCGNQISQFVWVVVFVAPVEEFVFRVVLPPRIGWVLGSVVLFAIFHTSVYLALLGISALPGALIYAGVLGGILYAVYNARDRNGDRIFGYGGSVGMHAAIDLTTLGIITTIGGGAGALLPLFIAHL